MVETYFKILAAIAPAVVLCVILVRKDRRPEPLKWLLAAVGLGVLAGPAVILINNIFLPDIYVDNFLGALGSAFINAAIPEEGIKFAALYFLVSKCRYFDEYFDGIVYCVCIGMGFAGLENILYLFGADDEWFVLGISRALLSVPAHYCFAVIMGAFFARGWFDLANRLQWYMLAFIVPVLAHGIYDTLCFSVSLDEGLSSIILLVFLLAFKRIRRYVKALTDRIQLMDEA